jgi:hypothetical protein
VQREIYTGIPRVFVELGRGRGIQLAVPEQLWSKEKQVEQGSSVQRSKGIVDFSRPEDKTAELTSSALLYTSPSSPGRGPSHIILASPSKADPATARRAKRNCGPPWSDPVDEMTKSGGAAVAAGTHGLHALRSESRTGFPLPS